MRIVLLNQFFAPDMVATAQLLTDLAQALAQDHSVTIICSGATQDAPCSSHFLGSNIKVIRTKEFGFSNRGRSRIGAYLSYLAGTVWQSIRLSRQDMYVTLTTPPILSLIGAILARVRGTPHLIWEMDVYPDIATDIGYFTPGGIVDRFVGAVLDWSRRRACGIIVLGEDMKARLVDRGIPVGKIYVAENWADGESINPLPLPEGPLVIGYSGNFGLAHEVDTVAELLCRLRNHPSYRFIFAGGGVKRTQLEEMCRVKGIHNVDFKPYCSRSDLGKSLGEAHLGFVTQLPATKGSVVPSKIYGIMAAGRPLLYIGPAGSTPAEHILRFKCGWHILPGEIDSLEYLLLHLNNNRHLVSEAGERGRNAFEKNFERSVGVKRILKKIVALRYSSEPVSKLTSPAIGD
jgi:colanic acid biosynthesis glycosyl transferase WcaI